MDDKADEPSTPRSVRILASELRKLHLRVGEPSSREIAAAIGGISHTTVNNAIRGRKVPSWPVLAKIVGQLGGDETLFRGLWSATREEGAPSERLPTPIAAARPAVSVFVSYASIDNKATHGRIEEIVQSVSDMYESMTGEKVGIFLDKNSLSAGENWRDAIKYELSSSAAFLAFLSPSYVRSAECNNEFWEFYRFLEANSSERLIVPLLFGDESRTRSAAEGTGLWEVASQLHMIDIGELRLAELGKASSLAKTEKIANVIDSVLTSVKRKANVVEDGPTSEAEDDDEIAPMLLEQMLKFERESPEMLVVMEGLTEQFEKVGNAVGVAGPVMNRATTTKRRLAVARQLARTLTPIVEDIEKSIEDFLSGLKLWDITIQTVFDYLSRQSNSDRTVGDARDALVSVRGFAVAGMEAFGDAEGMQTAIGQGRGLSRDLDVPLRKLQTAMLRLADTRAMFMKWRDGVDDLGDPDIRDPLVE